MSVLRLLVCAGGAEARQTLRRCAADVHGVERVDCAAGIGEARVRIGLSVPDAVVLDSRLQATVEELRGLVVALGGRPAFMVGSPADVTMMAAAMGAGIGGFLRPDVAPEELAAALAHASLAAPVPARLVPRPRLPGPRVALTEREQQVLSGMAAGRSNADIGRSLFLSEDTIKTHARGLFHKLAVHDRAHAVASGFRMGLVS